MENKITTKDKVQNFDNNIQKNELLNIKSKYILLKIFDNIIKKKKLEIIKYNKKMQKRFNFSLKDYKEYSEKWSSIELEINMEQNTFGKFININEDDKLFYHIYFNDNKEEIKNKYTINEEDKITKIKIIIDYQVNSFKKLFLNCKNIKSINFKKFKRNNINNMSFMLYYCSSLKELNLSNFNTEKVKDMSYMFDDCSSLKELNLSNFNTKNVEDLSSMFYNCSKSF